MDNNLNGWKFTDDKGTFTLPNPDRTSYLYFPLVNESMMMSSITPTLHGDIKIDHDHYLMPPVSVQDLHTSRAARNFLLRIDGKLWSVAGNAAGQDLSLDQTKLEAGHLWHRLFRENPSLGIQARVTNFVPPTNDQVELMRVDLTNTGGKPLSCTPVAAIPLYGRSADSLRDHRHVTSLLNRVSLEDYGILLEPTLAFNEEGHKPNNLQYGVFGVEGNGGKPLAFYPDVDSFIGEGGTLDRPRNDFSLQDQPLPDLALSGKEAFGGIRFANLTLQPGETQSYILILGIGQVLSGEALVRKYGSPDRFDRLLIENQRFWEKKLDSVKLSTGDKRFDNWVRWVSLQPILRRLMGNSYLPYHDYGRGGRGWRDLWQDALGLLLFESEDISDRLFAYFGGVRLDGSNATIIGSRPGEFKADRNNIPRVWMDHGVWPLKTVDLYLQQTGDLDFLLREQHYFKDRFTHRARQLDPSWDDSAENIQRSVSGQDYTGSILEHLIIQHLTAFFNVGEHNNILLEGADWNDGLDMAREMGESVAFTAFYAGNLKILSGYAEQLSNSGMKSIDLMSELHLLLDTLHDPVDYDQPGEKQERLKTYFDSVSSEIPGKKITLNLEELRRDLTFKADWMFKHLRQAEWLDHQDSPGWYNGYYDDQGRRVEGFFGDQVRMTLTGQTFPIMSGVATEQQIQEILEASEKYLFDLSVGGYRLNTDFGEIRTDLGRAFGFAYGTKENGAMFSHMAVMYAYALYARGRAAEGYRILKTIYEHSQNFPTSRMYPGIPEYFGPDGRGYYFYLTGSASWYLFTLITQVFGVRGSNGDLTLDPKLLLEQLDQDGRAKIRAQFAGKEFEFEFHNQDHLEVGNYRVGKITINDREVKFIRQTSGVLLERKALDKLDGGTLNICKVYLTE